MIKLEGEMGEHISDAAQRAIDLARPGSPVELEFNDITITVWHTLSASDVCAEYDRISNARRDAYLASPEYAASRQKAEEKERQRAAEFAAAMEKAPATLSLRDPAAWAKSVEVNSADPYSNAVTRYAEAWARVMEGMMAGGATLLECADKASHIADTEGITGFMYGCAVQILARCWVHGDELRRWHNWKHGVTEEKAKGGTVNPAVMTVGR